MTAEILIGVEHATKDGTVTLAVAGSGVLVRLHWVESLEVVKALIQASGAASAIAGVSRDDYVTAMFRTLEDVT